MITRQMPTKASDVSVSSLSDFLVRNVQRICQYSHYFIRQENTFIYDCLFGLFLFLLYSWKVQFVASVSC